MDDALLPFAPVATRDLGDRAAAAPGLPSSPLEERSFENGELDEG